MSLRPRRSDLRLGDKRKRGSLGRFALRDDWMIGAGRSRAPPSGRQPGRSFRGWVRPQRLRDCGAGMRSIVNATSIGHGPRDESCSAAGRSKERRMRRSRQSLAAASALAVAGLCALSGAVDACTSFVLAARDGARVYGRTMEFGLPLQSQLLVIPRGYALKGAGPDGADGGGLAWTSKYGAAGANGLGLPVLVDGMNEKGLA